MAGAIDQCVLSLDESEGHIRAEVAAVDRHSFTDFRRQLGGRANEQGDLVTGRKRLAQHVAAKGSGRAQDQYAGHGDARSCVLQQRGRLAEGRPKEICRKFDQSCSRGSYRVPRYDSRAYISSPDSTRLLARLPQALAAQRDARYQSHRRNWNPGCLPTPERR